MGKYEDNRNQQKNNPGQQRKPGQPNQQQPQRNPQKDNDRYK